MNDDAQGVGNAPAPLYRSSFRVVMADTDAAHVIYFVAPIVWAERLVTTWLADSGCATSQMLRDGLGLPAVRCEADYRSTFRLDDVVSASLWVDRRTRRSVTFRSEFRLDGHDEAFVVVRVTQVQAETRPEGLRSVNLISNLAAALDDSWMAVQQRGEDE